MDLPGVSLISTSAAQQQHRRLLPPRTRMDAGLDIVLKRADDVLWFTRLSDIADVDKVEYTSLPPAHAANPKSPGAVNPLIIHAYTFIPKNLDRSKKQPLITFAHQGVHANFDTSDLHVIRELLQQGYSIIASDYRGSTGYGRRFTRKSITAAARSMTYF